MKKQQLLYHILLLMFFFADATAQPTVLPPFDWKVAGTLPPANGQPGALGLAGAATGVHNNVLLVAGGANFPNGMPWLGGPKMYYREGFVFRKARKDSLVMVSSFALPAALAYSANCTTPLGVVAAGGENESGLQNKVLLLQWDETAQTVRTGSLPSLPFAVTNASLAFHHNKLYLAGGERARDVSDELWVLDMTDTVAGWKQLPSLPRPVSHAVMVVQSDGKKDGLYLLGGRQRNPGGLSDLYASVFRFDLQKGTWTEKKPLPYALSAGTGVSAGRHSILLFGGDTGETFHKTEALIAAIGREPDTAKKQVLNKEKTAVQAAHPGFCRQVLHYDTKEDQWSPYGCIPFAAPVTTTAVTWGSAVYLPSGEIKAGVRTPEILMTELNEDLAGF